MAAEQTKIADVLVGRPFTDYVQLMSTVKSALWQSGIVVSDPTLSAKLAGAGRLFDVNHWNDLADDASNVGTDDPTDVAETKKVTSLMTTSMRNKRNQHWSVMDLVPAYTADDPANVVARRLINYWTRQFQAYLIAALKGIILDDAADADDMSATTYSDVASPAPANYFNISGFLAALQTLGDASDQIVAVAVHSATYRYMQKMEMVEYVVVPETATPGEGRAQYTASGVNPAPSGINIRRVAQFLGHEIIVDDSMWTTAGTNSPQYTSVAFGPGAFGFGESLPKTPAEISREPLQGNGEGQEIYSSRREFMMHPQGFDILTAGVAGYGGPTNAELALAACWDRKYTRKLVPLAIYHHN